MQLQRSRKMSKFGIFLIFAAVFSFIVFYLSVMLSNQGYSFVDLDTMELVQTQEIEEGSPIAVIQTSAGEMRAVLYPEEAPRTVENFIALANAGFYDNTYIFDGAENVYFAAGSVDSSGRQKQAVIEEQERIPRELSQNLWPFKGALCAMNTVTEGGVFDRFFNNVTYYTGSRFRVMGSVDFSDEEYLAEFREATGSEELADTFITWGGVPNFSQQFTVFGQVYAGLDVIDTICSCALEEETNISGFTPPKEELLILSVTIGEYGEEDAQLNELP